MSLAAERDETHRRIDDLRAAIAAGRGRSTRTCCALERLRQDVRDADEVVSAFRVSADEHEAIIKDARAALEAVRATVAELDIARATAEGDLAHLAASCLESLQATIDEVVVEVDELERRGGAMPDSRVICAEEPKKPSETEPVKSETTSRRPTSGR